MINENEWPVCIKAASTVYGPHTLDAYLQQFPTLVQSMIDVSWKKILL